MTTSQGGYVNGGFDLLKAPDAPTITSVTNGIGNMSVAFTAPANPGGSAVTGYTVTAINESTGASVGATGSASPISISPGSGTFKVRAAAANVYGPGRVSAFSTGNAPYSGASLWAWGDNGFGQTGLGLVGGSRSSPVQVGALTDWSRIAAGVNGGASVKTNGTLWGWGFNGSGQLGDNTTTYKTSPIQIGVLTNWYQISRGSAFTVSIKTDGTLWSWGYNAQGQLGQNNTTGLSSPVQVGALTNWAQISVGTQHTIATKTDGTLWSWGYNPNGQLGDGTTTRKSSPIQIGSLTNWYSVAANVTNSAAVKIDGTLWTWGNNQFGQIGNGLAAAGTNVLSPVQVGALTNWSQAACGERHTASVKTDGTLWAWGHNQFGPLGQNNIIYRSSPVQVGTQTDWLQASAGFDATFVVKTGGTLWSWGRNASGQLGQGDIINRSSPVQVGALTSWVNVQAGRQSSAFTLALYGVT
jgi:hypothetical protein